MQPTGISLSERLVRVRMLRTGETRMIAADEAQRLVDAGDAEVDMLTATATQEGAVR